MNNRFKTKLTLLLAAAAGFVAGRWGNTETKERISQRLKGKHQEQRSAPSLHEGLEGDVTLDEYEMLSYHN